MAEQAGAEVTLEEALEDYLSLLATAPAERVQLDVTGEIRIEGIDADPMPAPDTTDDATGTL